MYKFYLLFLVLFILHGCAAMNVQPYDSAGFKIHVPGDSIAINSELKTGLIKMGHSGWIHADDYEKGILPEYFCPEPGPHDWMGSYWIFDKKDQMKFIENLNAVLRSNGIYSKDSENILEIHFMKAEQGPRDSPVYTFDVQVTYFEKGESKYTKKHHLVGNKTSEEFWNISGSWDPAKERASNRLMSVIVHDFNAWLNKSI